MTIELSYADEFDPFLEARRDPLDFYEPEQIAARQVRWDREWERPENAEWADKDADPYADEGEDLDISGPYEYVEPAQASPVVRALPKVGRNAPCPCGSGRKFKKCCL